MAVSRRRTVNITFSSPGAQPPVYVAGEFTNPPWRPVELNLVSSPTYTPEHTAVTFSKAFEVAEGSWQYKFRLGDGDWWECDSNTEIVTDSSGNRNNLLVVTSDMASGSMPSSEQDVGVGASLSLEVARQSQEELQKLPSPTHHEDSDLSVKQGRGSPEDAFKQLLDASEAQRKVSRSGKPPSSLPDMATDVVGKQVNEATCTKEELDSRRKSANDVDEIYHFNHSLAPQVSNQTEFGNDHAAPANGVPSTIEYSTDVKHDNTNVIHLPGREEPEVTGNIPKPQLASLHFESDDDLDELDSPLLPHERLSFVSAPLEFTSSAKASARNSVSARDFEGGRSNSLCCPSATEEHFHDPSIEIFPTGRDNILRRVRTLQEELEVDDCSHLEHSSSTHSEHRPKRKSSASDAKRNGVDQRRLSSQSGTFMSPIRSSTQLEPILQETGGLDGMGQAKGSMDAQSMSSYRTALSHSPGLVSPSEYSVQLADSRRQVRSRQITPLIPSRKSSVEVSSPSKPEPGNVAFDGTAKDPPSPIGLGSETEERPLLQSDGFPGQVPPAECSVAKPRDSSPKAVKRGSPTRYRARSNSPHLVRGSRSPSPYPRQGVNSTEARQRWYHKVLAWLKKFFQTLFAKKKDA